MIRVEEDERMVGEAYWMWAVRRSHAKVMKSLRWIFLSELRVTKIPKKLNFK